MEGSVTEKQSRCANKSSGRVSWAYVAAYDVGAYFRRRIIRVDRWPPPSIAPPIAGTAERARRGSTLPPRPPTDYRPSPLRGPRVPASTFRIRAREVSSAKAACEDRAKGETEIFLPKRSNGNKRARDAPSLYCTFLLERICCVCACVFSLATVGNEADRSKYSRANTKGRVVLFCYLYR
jgi:hypothetical protein